MTSKLIILRGPSASGKSTVATELFKKATRNTCLIEQDYYRFMFRPRDHGSKQNSATMHKMITNNVLTALSDGYDVIAEGIFSTKSYANDFIPTILMLASKKQSGVTGLGHLEIRQHTPRTTYEHFITMNMAQFMIMKKSFRKNHH